MAAFARQFVFRNRVLRAGLHKGLVARNLGSKLPLKEP